MKLSEQIIKKGTYSYSAPTDPVIVQKYIIIRQRGKKCLLLRFKNNSEFTVNRIEYEIVLFKKNGEIIERFTVKTPPINEAPGSVFTFSDGFWLGDECDDFKINFLSVRSGDYEYNFIGHDYIVSYSPLNIHKAPSLYDGGNSHDNNTHYRYKKQNAFPFAVIVASVTVLTILGIILFPYLGAFIL